METYRLIKVLIFFKTILKIQCDFNWNQFLELYCVLNANMKVSLCLFTNWEPLIGFDEKFILKKGMKVRNYPVLAKVMGLENEPDSRSRVKMSLLKLSQLLQGTSWELGSRTQPMGRGQTRWALKASNFTS